MTAHSDASPIVALGDRHVAGAVALSAEAHWNQTASDWRMMLVAGDGIGVEDEGGRLVASALTLPHGDEFGWVSMVLVTETHRRRGLATGLLHRCIDTLEGRGLIPVLDATPAGEPVYRPLGFEPHFRLQRWERAAGSGSNGAETGTASSRVYRDDDLAAVLAYDRAVFGGDRSAVLAGIAGRGDGVARVATDGQGYLFSRDGRVARHIGPVAADDPVVARDMLVAALAGIDGAVFIDVPDRQAGIVETLKAHGFRPQRPFLRMAKGTSVPFGDPARVFAIAGPELG